LMIARTPHQQPASCVLTKVLQALDHAWHDRFARAGRPLRISDVADVPRVAGSGAVLRHALDVLVDNALVHGAGETRIEHSVGATTVTISLTDSGPGFGGQAAREPQPAAPHNFGLPLARRLIATMPGRLEIVQRGPHPQIDVTLTLAGDADP
ncbi:MAG: ATP-binding protein, partial [Ilumatobacteraceae bacterium]